MDEEIIQLRKLVHDMALVIEDMMNSTGGALIVQDYGRLNDVLIREGELTRREKKETQT